MDRIETLKSTLLGQYQVRKTYAQKTAFIDWAQAYIRAFRDDVRIEESGKHFRSRNLIVGDVDKARTIITAHYDTCARLPVSNFMTPGQPVLVIVMEALMIAALFALGFAVGNGTEALIGALSLPAWIGFVSVFLGIGITFGILALMFVGPANPHTANDNTSGVLLAMLAMHQLKDCPGVAFVLFDHEELGLIGSSAFMKAHPQAAGRFLLNLDCVGDGSTLLYTGSKSGMRMPQAKRMLSALEELAPQAGFSVVSGSFPRWIYPSDQMLFPRGTAVAALKGRRILYMNRIHTKRDTVLDIRNIRMLMRVLERAAL